MGVRPVIKTKKECYARTIAPLVNRLINDLIATLFSTHRANIAENIIAINIAIIAKATLRNIEP